MSAASGARPLAIVTGAGRRVGRAVAIELGRGGCDVVLTTRKIDAEVREAAELVQRAAVESGGEGRHAHVLEIDAGDPEQAAELGRRVERDHGRADVLVLNASMYRETPLRELTGAALGEFLRVNAAAPVMLAKELSGLLGASTMAGGGSIVAMIDIHAMGLPTKNYLAYTMSKAALHEAVRSLARELAPKVRVNGIAPGVVAWPEEGKESQTGFKESYLSLVPLRRAGTPEDAAAAVRWLALEARYTTGHVVPVDGGRHLR